MKVAQLSDRALSCWSALLACWERGIELIPDDREDQRGSGLVLQWEDEA